MPAHSTPTYATPAYPRPARRLLNIFAVVLSLLLASALCVATVEFRSRHTHDPSYRFLDWNLFLAWIPVALALAAQETARRRHGFLTAALSVLWLLFFPNAPYMLTDFIHLGESPGTPLWYDGLMLSSFAWTALLLGFFSLYLMQGIWRRAVGPLIAWIGVVAALALGSLGVYIGRFVHYNSWDALLHPTRIAHLINDQLENPFHHPRLELSLLALTGFLTIAYAVFYSTTSLQLGSRRHGPATRDQA